MQSHRTTFSLDAVTVGNMRQLAQIWRTSQAGVIRRALREAADAQRQRLSPAQALAVLRAGAVELDSAQLARWLDEARSDRHEVDQHRS